MAKISQREAHRMRKELRELHERDASRERSWSSDWPGGIHIATSRPNADVLACIQTARKLGHFVIGVVSSDGVELRHYASNRSAKP